MHPRCTSRDPRVSYVTGPVTRALHFPQNPKWILTFLSHASPLASLLLFSVYIFPLSVYIPPGFLFSSEIAFSVAYSSAKQFWSFLSSSSIACARKKRSVVGWVPPRPDPNKRVVQFCGISHRGKSAGNKGGMGTPRG